MSARLHCLIGLSALLLAGAGTAQAQSYLRGADRVEMSIVDRDEDETVPLYPAQGQLWAPGTPGHRYSVQLTNRTPSRVLVVLSVDGVNAVSGQSARANQAGYVLEPFQTTEVSGWRKSMAEVAQFYFSDMRDSYAARTGRPQNVGVIGIAVFDEARRMPPPRVFRDAPMAKAESADAPAAPAAASAPPMAGARAQELGTGHGEREYAPVSRTGFVRSSIRPVQITEVRYDDAYALADRGIIPRRGGRRYGEPRAFGDRFVPDPPRGW